MYKLVKVEEGKVRYWEISQRKKTLIEHFGLVGDKGRMKELVAKSKKKAQRFKKELIMKKYKEGYTLLDGDTLTPMIIQYNFDVNALEEELSLRQQLTERISKKLVQTGNGMCDGGELNIANHCTTIFNYVINVDKANATLQSLLRKHDMLSRVRIAYVDEQENYVMLYAENATAKIM